MSAADPLWEAVIPVLDALEALGAPHYIGGSVASSLQGVFRSTNDVDLVADLRHEQAAALAAALARTHACDAAWNADAVARHGCFNALHEVTGFKVDVFVPEMTGFAARAMERRAHVPVPILGRSVPVASPEDVVIQKLRWFRVRGESSERQWLDVRGVVRLHGTALDAAHMRQWAAALGVADLLERAVSDASGHPACPVDGIPR